MELELELPLLLAPSLLGVLEEPEDSDEEVLDSVFEAAGPFVELVDDRESVMYHPLPLNTIPTG